MATEQRLYTVEWNGRDDYLPDAALDHITEVVLSRLPDGGFDVPSMQASRKSVTATIAFDGLADAMSQGRAAEALFQAATVVRTLHANLAACRSALAAALAKHKGLLAEVERLRSLIRGHGLHHYACHEYMWLTGAKGMRDEHPECPPCNCWLAEVGTVSVDGKCNLCGHDLSVHGEGPCVGNPGRDVPRCRRCSAASIASRENQEQS